MAYTKENKLRRIIDVQQCFRQYYKPGMSVSYIYAAHIYPLFKISKRTFNKWLKYPAESELKNLLNNKPKPVYKQTALNFSDKK